MALRYTFRHLFYGGNINKKRLYKILEDLDNAESEDTDISALEEKVETLEAKVKALEDASG